MVTGASAGIGREFSEQLAALGMNLVLVARTGPALEALGRELATRSGIRTLAVPLDLADASAVGRLRERTAEAGVRIRLLVNNAAIGHWGAAEARDARFTDGMVQLNVAAPVQLCLAFLPDLAAQAPSAIINVSSPAALQPVPYMATYAASKAFLSSFSQALHGEWGARGIVVQTLVPGPTETEFDRHAGAPQNVGARVPPRGVVADSLASLERGDPVVWSARGTFKQRLFAGLAPPRMVIREVAKMFKPPTSTS